MSRLILCADDYGFSREISSTIVELARWGKINAISCMVACPGWADDAAWLEDLPTGVEIGLHLVLSDEAPLTRMPVFAPEGRMPSINALGRRAMLNKLPLEEIEAEVMAQFRRFQEVMGRAPDFVDGHQHSHLLKGIRHIVLALTAQRAPRAWLRSCTDSFSTLVRRPFPLKALANAVQSRGFAREAARYGLRCNDSFSGLYDFSSDFAELMPRFMNRPGSLHLVICHPGHGAIQGDTIAQAREREASALRLLPIRDMAGARGLRFGD